MSISRQKVLGAAIVGLSMVFWTMNPGFAGELTNQYAGTTLNLVTCEITPTAALDAQKEEFERMTGIKINHVFYDEVTVRDKLVLDYAARAGNYHLGEMQWWFTPEYAGSGFVEPLDDYIKNKVNPQYLNMDDFFPPLLQGLAYEGKQYALPFWYLGAALYYRKDIFEENGWEVPGTIAETLEILDKFEALQSQGSYKDMYGWVGRGSKTFDTFGSIAGFAWAYGPKLFDDEMKPTLVSDPRWKEAMEDWVHIMVDHGPPGAGNLNWMDTYNLFMQGKILMFTETSDYGPDFKNPEMSVVADKVGFASAPVGPSGKAIQWVFTDGITISADISDDAKDAAWLFLQWSQSKEVLMRQTRLSRTGRRFNFPYPKLMETPAYYEAAREANLEDWAQLQHDVLQTLDFSYWPWIPDFIKVSESLASRISAVLAGTLSIDEALKMANEEIISR